MDRLRLNVSRNRACALVRRRANPPLRCARARFSGTMHYSIAQSSTQELPGTLSPPIHERRTDAPARPRPYRGRACMAFSAASTTLQRTSTRSVMLHLQEFLFWSYERCACFNTTRTRLVHGACAAAEMDVKGWKWRDEGGGLEAGGWR